MIDVEKYEKKLLETQKSETGKPFNKWTPETRTQLAQERIEFVNKLNSELELHRHELVIFGFNIVRLQDVDDDDLDYYWIYNENVSMIGMDNGDKGIMSASCVIGHTYLKGVLPEDEYNNLVRFWNSNNLEKAI
jgi:hypothetical protein